MIPLKRATAESNNDFSPGSLIVREAHGLAGNQRIIEGEKANGLTLIAAPSVWQSRHSVKLP